MELWEKELSQKQIPEWNRVVNDPNYANIQAMILYVRGSREVGDGPTILQEMIDNAKAESPVSHMELFWLWTG